MDKVTILPYDRIYKNFIDPKYLHDGHDEHYYRNNQWFYTNGDRYHADKVRGADGLTYDRQRPTRVFVGEFANNNSNND